MVLRDQKHESVENADQARVSQTLELIKTLLSSLPTADRTRFLHELSATIKPNVDCACRRSLGRDRPTVSQARKLVGIQLKQTIEDRGIPATAKELYNAVSYLARRGHIRRIGYGRYLIDGVPVVSTEDFGGQPSITEGDSDD